MNRRLFRKGALCFTILLTLLGAACQNEKEITIENVKLYSKSLEKNSLKITATRNVIVCLPPSYYENSDKRYPVVYLLHGLGAKAEAWFSDRAGDPNVKNSLNMLYNKKDLKEMIVVVPDSYNDHFLGGWYSNSDSAGNWEDYIIKDLIPYIDRNYRTIDSRKSRGIVGHSMGGYGAFKLGVKNLKLFTALYPMSVPLSIPSAFEYLKSDLELKNINNGFSKPKQDWEFFDFFYYSIMIAYAPANTAPFYCQLPVSEKQITLIQKNTLINLISKNMGLIKKYKPVIKMDIGDKDFLVGQAREFTQKLKELGVKHTYSEYAGGHSDKLSDLTENSIFQFFSENLED